jgi:microcystin-dependent protein
MAITVDTYVPFATGPGQVATVSQWEKLAQLLGCRNGVGLNLSAEALVFADGGMQIHVSAGAAVVNGHYADWAATKTLGLGTASATQSRVDRVVLRLKLATSTMELDVVQGVDGSAVPQALVQTSTTWEIPLARIGVPAGDTSIDPSQVTDERGFAFPFGTEIGDAHMTFRAGAANSAELILNGQNVSRVTYGALMLIPGMVAGPGDGVTTFTLPKASGLVPVGLDATQSEFSTIGKVGGAKQVTLTAAQMPIHSHGGITDTQTDNHTHAVGISNNHRHAIGQDGGSQPHSVLQPYIVCQWAVRAR